MQHTSYAKKVIFLSKKWMKGIFVYVLEFVLIQAEMQSKSTLPLLTARHISCARSYKLQQTRDECACSTVIPG